MEVLIREIIINRYRINGRDFPWRHTKDPYKITIAEFMLHRTKAEQVIPVYQEFIKKYPDVYSLAKADEKEIKKVTEHLGLHWRSKHFLKAAKYVVETHEGCFPDDRGKLMEVPGIGEYIAGAILAVCFNKPSPVVDSNIARFINRFYGFNLKGEIRRKKWIIEKSVHLFKYKEPSKFLFALIDFTSLVCRPLKPRCDTCPLKNYCEYFRSVA